MCTINFLKVLILNLLLLHRTYCELFNPLNISSHTVAHSSVTRSQMVRVPLRKSPYEPSESLNSFLNDNVVPKSGASPATGTLRRNRRLASLAKRETSESVNSIAESSFQKDEVGWSVINAEVDIIVPMIIMHLKKLNIEHLELPDIRETIAVTPLLSNYDVGLHLSNGVAYNIAGIQRFGDAFMTYKTDKSFLCRFRLIIKTLQFEYDFLLKLMAIEGYGRVIGSLDDTIIFGELAISVTDTRLRLNDFRITSFGNIQVQLNHQRIIRQLSGAILSPITNLFRDRITTSISDGLKEQIQLIMDDFNDNDPLQLKTFAKQMLAGLTKGITS